MIKKEKNTKQIVIISFLLVNLAFNIFIQIPGIQNIIFDSRRESNNKSEQDLVKISETDYYTKDWITNGDFSSGSINWTSDIDGDTSDVNMLISGGEASYEIIGESFTKEISDPIDTSTASDWVAFNKSEPAINPDSYGIDDSGFYASHSWHDATADQFASITWRYNVSMGVDMSNYIITGADLEAIMNATVDENVDTPLDDECRPGQALNQPGIFDHALFYVELADMDLNTYYRILFNKTNDLGQDQPPYSNTVILYYDDKSIERVADEQDLMYYLTSLFEKDPGHDELAIIVGIDIECEDDNTATDYDDWTSLRIKSVNCTFTYEKKIDPLTKGSWTQYGDAIPSNYEIDNATLNFKYKCNKDWSSNTGSVNSEFRIIINNNQLGKTVKLSTATTSYQDFEIGGLDVANFLSANEEVNVTIQVYIGDEFTLDSDIVVSIDDVTLDIDYGIYTEPDDTTYELFLEEEDRTTEKSTQVTFNEDLNITLIYKDSLGSFIPDADVELTGGGLTPITLDEGASDYYTTINSTELGVGPSYLTLTATKRYYTTQEFQITVEVINRDTEIQLFLDMNNRTVEKEWTTEWKENLNITIRYGDIQNGPFKHISGATVELTGVGSTKTLNEDTDNEQYEIEINTSNIGEGGESPILQVYASKDNYTSLNVKFKIIISTRPTYLDNLIMDTVETDSIEITWNELFDISVSFNDSITDNFISGASVQLLGTDYSEPLSESGVYHTYDLTVDTFDLSIGNNFMTVVAQLDNYTIASRLITITVEERPTTIDTILNHTSAIAINYPYGELLNITVIYEDQSGPFLDEANVELRDGSTGNWLYNLTKSLLFDQYSVTINTNQLTLGQYIIYAKQDNFTAEFVSITINVEDRDTYLEIYLEESLTNVIEREYDETINISVIFKDFISGTYIDGATVDLRQGENILYPIFEHGSFEQYDLTINTKNLALGTNSLAICAEKGNYSAVLEGITIIVKEKTTFLDTFLEETQTTAIEVMYGEMINFTVIYEDSEGGFIDGANVELQNGTTTLDSFDKHGTFDQYFLEMNSDQFIGGKNYVLSIYAKKDNYSVSLVTIYIAVNKRDSTLDVLLNGIDSSTFEIFNISINDMLDITAIYEDITPVFISSGTVELTGSGISESLPLHPTLNQYNYTLNPEVLGEGVHFLTISANSQNYTTSLINIKLNILARASNIQLFIDDINVTDSKYVATEIDKILNVTVFYTDISDDSFIPTAHLKLTGTLNEDLTENSILQQYNVSIKTNDLVSTITTLTIFAQKEEYESQSIVFTIEVKEKASDLLLFLNDKDINETAADRSIEVIIGDLVNVTVIYEDYSHFFIDNAEVTIGGEGIDLNLTRHLTYDQYNITINTNDLKLGINRLTLYAKKANFELRTLSFEIFINDKATDMHIFLNGDDKTDEKSLTLPIRRILNVTVQYLDNDTGIGLSGATIQLVGEGFSEYLNENISPHQYSTTINTTQLGRGPKFLTIYATRTNYQSYSALIYIQVNQIPVNVSTVSRETIINRQPGQDYKLEIEVLDLEFLLPVLQANVTYTWTYGQGTLIDPENDGIYEKTLSNLRVGTFDIIITVYAGDDYEFELFTLTLNVVRPPEDVLLFQILTFVGVGAAIGLGGYLFAYQRVLKYPKQVRKIRKYKSKIKKAKSTGIEVRSRDQLIEDTYAEKMRPLEKQLSKIPKTGKNMSQNNSLKQSENKQN